MSADAIFIFALIAIVAALMVAGLLMVGEMLDRTGIVAPLLFPFYD